MATEPKNLPSSHQREDTIKVYTDNTAVPAANVDQLQLTTTGDKGKNWQPFGQLVKY